MVNIQISYKAPPGAVDGGKTITVPQEEGNNLH